MSPSDNFRMYSCKQCGIYGPSYRLNEVVGIEPDNHFLCQSHAYAYARILKAEASWVEAQAAAIKTHPLARTEG